MTYENEELQNQKQIHICVVSDITLEPHIKKVLKAQFSDLLHPIFVYTISVYDYMEEENLEAIHNSNLCVIWMNYEKYIEEYQKQQDQNEDEKVQTYFLENIQTIHDNIRNITTAKLIWVGLEDYYEKIVICTGNIITGLKNVDVINQSIATLIGVKSTLIDLKRVIAEVGISNAYDFRGKYRWDSPYSQCLIQRVGYEIWKAYKVFQGIGKKCIVLDCDNVLWGGIVSEDGIQNIRLGGMNGKLYKEFQTLMVRLHDMGVILTVCSKNDLSDIQNVFRNHPDMVVKEEQIAMFVVNWESKAKNIQYISETLNIGLEHMVFIDDSMFEINEVQTLLPQVQAIVFDRNTMYQELATFHLTVHNSKEEIELRNITYKTNVEREQLKQCYDNYSDYLDALDMKIEIQVGYNIFRIAELSQRTNKFTNGKRYDLNSLSSMIKGQNYEVYSVHLSDKYSDIGLVGAIGVYHNDGNEILDLFCLSCRALGRKVEEHMIAFIKSKYSITQFFFASTNKNSKVQTLLEENFWVN